MQPKTADLRNCRQDNVASSWQSAFPGCSVRYFCLLSVSWFVFYTTVIDHSVLAQPPKLLEVTTGQGRLVGLPIHWGTVDAVLMETSGSFHLLDLDNVRSHRLLPNNYVPQSLSAARSDLQRELGPQFELAITGPYVIATPAGQSNRWQERFRALLSGYQRYFDVRGWSLRKPDFPLVVIVFPNRQQFIQYARMEGGRLPSNAVGSYFPRSNRCILYQISDSRGTDWQETEATIIHEAVHQLAYNTGVHERLFQNPLWTVEGLATMFEVRGVYDWRSSSSSIVSRFHEQKIRTLQPILKDSARLTEALQQLVMSDSAFQSNPQLAYALSWGLSFYLSERMPTAYKRLTALQAERGFGSYAAEERLRDFRQAVNSDWRTLASDLQRLLSR